MKGERKWLCFWILVAVVIVIAALICIPGGRGMLRTGTLISVGGIALFVAGGALVFFTVKEKTGGRLRMLLILTGASAMGITAGVVLHNVVYGLFISLFGADFWKRIGLMDEPVFFIFALIVCPIAFLIGSIGTIVYYLKHRN
jgi:hypothetical protein